MLVLVYWFKIRQKVCYWDFYLAFISPCFFCNLSLQDQVYNEFHMFLLGIMCELLWSDPSPTLGRSPSKRGVGVAFGSDVTKNFLKQNNLGNSSLKCEIYVFILVCVIVCLYMYNVCMCVFAWDMVFINLLVLFVLSMQHDYFYVHLGIGFPNF